MTRHQQRVEELLQNISWELANLVYLAFDSSGRSKDAEERELFFYQNVNDLRTELGKDLERDLKPHGIKKLVRWFKLKLLA